MDDAGYPAVLYGHDVYRLAFRDLHFTRNAYSTTHGHVVAKSHSTVDLRVPAGLPTPLVRDLEGARRGGDREGEGRVQ